MNVVNLFRCRSRVDDGVPPAGPGGARSKLRPSDVTAREADRAVLRLQGTLRRLFDPRQVCGGLLLRLQRDIQVCMYVNLCVNVLLICVFLLSLQVEP